MHVRRPSIFVALIVLISAPAPAQESSEHQVIPDSEGELGIDIEGTLAFAVGLPQGELKDNGLDAGYGFDLTVLARGSKWPVLVGLELGYIAYGESTATVPLSTTTPGAFVELATRNGILNFHGLLRVQPWRFFVTPYVDGLGGLKYFQTTTNVSDPATGNSVSTTLNFSDTTWSAGVGGGVLIGGSSKKGSIGLDVGLRYLWGGTAEYALEGFVPTPPLTNTLRSRTDLLVLYVGIYGRL
jgi:hypothetical protein